MPDQTRRNVLNYGAKILGGFGGMTTSTMGVASETSDTNLREQNADKWPMGKRGPARTGATPGATGPTPPVKVKWRFIPETGAAHTPVVAGDTVYVVTGTPDENKDGGANLIAVNTATGEERWRFTQPTATPGPPAVVGDTTYIATTERDSTLYAVDTMTGKERWRITPQYLPDTQYISAVAVANGTVYAGTNGSTTTGQSETPAITTVDPTNTTPVNDTEAVIDIEWNTRGKKRAVYAVDAATGEERWRHRHWTGGPVAPVIVDDTVYVGSWGPAGTVYALDAQSGDEQWRFPQPVGGTVAPAVANNTVYVGSLSDDGAVYAINASTGVKRWQFTPEVGATVAPTVVNGTVYTGGMGPMYALDAQSGEKQWRFSQQIYGSPAIAGGTVYIGGTQKNRNYVKTTTKDKQNEMGSILFAVNAKTGLERWRFTEPTQPILTPTVAGNTLYVAGRALYALE